MTLTQLHYIITIAQTKSLNKAAEQLFVSQPSLTSAVKELEKEMKQAAADLQFERAAQLRDQIFEYKVRL